MQIPFVDLHAQYLSLKPEMDRSIQTVIDECAFIKGKYVKQFEEQFASLMGVKHCIGVANGTDAIFIVLKMLGIGSGDEVITTATSWIATSETVGLTGAKPVFVDIDPKFYTIDESKIEAAITPKTRAIIPVHLYGQISEMNRIREIAKKHNLIVIEDCAQSHFSAQGTEFAGTMGLAGTFSFYPGKNLGAYGDAGCIVTNDDQLAEKCRMFSNHGQLEKNKHAFEGINSRLDGLQAAVLLTKLPHLKDWNRLRLEHSNRYRDLLKGIDGLQLPELRTNSTHTQHIFGIRTTHRNALKKFLQDKGVETAIHYPTALPLTDAYAGEGYTAQTFPQAYAHQEQELSLPLFPEMSEGQIEYVVDAVREFFRSHS